MTETAWGSKLVCDANLNPSMITSEAANSTSR